MLTGKTYRITGVASGIGLRTAELAMHQGAAPERPPTSRPWLLFAASGAARWINGANIPAASKRRSSQRDGLLNQC